MPIELSELMEFAAGRKPAIQVGDLPRPVAEFLRCHPAIVWLGIETFYKIAKKHPEIAVAEFQQLFLLVASGAYYLDPDRPRSVTVYRQLADSPEFYMTALKSAAGGCEVWVQTFHRTNEKQISRITRSCTLIHQGR